MILRDINVGNRLRAYRLESGLRAEEIAARLGMSRDVLYRYERGELYKITTLSRFAETLNIPLVSLLGISAEYFSRPVAFLERLRQAEEMTGQILQVGGAVCYPVTTDAYDGALAEIWTEVADAQPERLQARTAADQALDVLRARKKLRAARRAPIIAILGETALKRMLTEGVAGGIALSERTRTRARAAAMAEAQSIAAAMEGVPIGLQIGLIAGPDPSAPFTLCKGRERTQLCAAPFSPEALPIGQVGVAMVTSVDEAVSIHQRVAEAAWRDALKGEAAAQRVRDLIAQAG